MTLYRTNWAQENLGIESAVFLQSQWVEKICCIYQNEDLSESSDESSDIETESEDLEEQILNMANSCCNSNCGIIRSICRAPLSVAQMKVLKEMREYLSDNLHGADAKWMIFVSAVFSYRFRLMVQPYPPAYLDASTDNRGIDDLSLVIANMPDFVTLQRELQANRLRLEKDSFKYISLLHWLLMESGVPQVRLLQTQEEEELLWQQLGQRPCQRPHLVFCVESAKRHLNGNACCFYSGHTDQLYSLISGRAQTKSLHLTVDLQLACDMTVRCPGWGQSLCGSILRCVAICEWQKAEYLRVRYILIYGQRLELPMRAQRQEENVFHHAAVSPFSIMRRLLSAFTLMMFSNSLVFVHVSLWLRRIGGLFKQKLEQPVALLKFVS